MESAIIIFFGHVGLSTAMFVLRLRSIRGHYLLVTDFSCILSQCYWLFLTLRAVYQMECATRIFNHICLPVSGQYCVYVNQLFQHTISVVHYFTLLQA